MEEEKIGWLMRTFTRKMMKQTKPRGAHLCDYQSITQELRIGDVLLIEGNTRASAIIKEITQSVWSHAALYIGNINHIQALFPKAFSKNFEKQPENNQYLLESEIGLGTIISPLYKYEDYHIRIARPRGLAEESVYKVIEYALGRLGSHYNRRHLFDLARFLFPWALYPRRWRSVLFEHNALQPTHDICSSLIAHAFQSVRYPILPHIKKDDMKTFKFTRRNPNLFTPSDFDYSPYFDIIKYPILPPRQFKTIDWNEGEFDDE